MHIYIYIYIWSLIKHTLWWSRTIHLSLFHYPNLINKFIGRQKLTATTEIQKSQKLSETNKEPFFMEGKVRNLKLKLKRLTLWRTANSYRISFKVLHLNVSVTSKSILLRWWFRTTIYGTSHAVWVRGHSFHIATSACIFLPWNNRRETRLICSHFV